MQGTIKVESLIDQGSVFEVVLPFQIGGDSIALDALKKAMQDVHVLGIELPQEAQQLLEKTGAQVVTEMPGQTTATYSPVLNCSWINPCKGYTFWW